MKKQLFALTLLLTPFVAQACEVCYGRQGDDTSAGMAREHGTEMRSEQAASDNDMDDSGTDEDDDSGADEDDESGY